MTVSEKLCDHCHQRTFENEKKVEPSFFNDTFIGALGGFAFYYIIQRKADESLFKNPKPLFYNATPYVLQGVIYSGIIFTINKTYQTIKTWHIYEQLNQNGASLANQFRYHTWKVLDKTENMLHRVDALFSRIFNIRTLREITDQKIQAMELFELELIRKAFLYQISSVKRIVAVEISRNCLKSLGYTLAGQQTILLLLILSLFINSVTPCLVRSNLKYAPADHKNEIILWTYLFYNGIGEPLPNWLKEAYLNLMQSVFGRPVNQR